MFARTGRKRIALAFHRDISVESSINSSSLLFSPLFRMTSPLSLGSKRRGFTLIELIIVIAIIAIIVAAVFVAIDPAKRLNTSRNSRRNQDVSALASAIQLWRTDIITAGGTPTAVADTNATTWQQIGTSSGTPCNITCVGGPSTAGCIDLSTASVSILGGETYSLVPKYIKSLPRDPKGGSDALTRYAINEQGGTIIIRACNSEGEQSGGAGTGPTIEASR